jgi:hypothetical protein
MTPPLVQPGRYRVLDHAGHLTGVLVIEHARAAWGGLVHVCRWAGERRRLELTGAELGRLDLQPARFA